MAKKIFIDTAKSIRLYYEKTSSAHSAVSENMMTEKHEVTNFNFKFCIGKHLQKRIKSLGRSLFAAVKCVERLLISLFTQPSFNGKTWLTTYNWMENMERDI